MTADNLMRLAFVVAELEGRGESLEGLRMGLLPILRKIAAGTLLPDVVVLYAGQPRALNKVAAMSIEEQTRIVSRGTISGTPEAEPVETAPKGAASKSRARCPAETNHPTVASVARAGNSRDIAEMACTLVCNSSDPDLVLVEYLTLAVQSGVLSKASVAAVKQALASLAALGD